MEWMVTECNWSRLYVAYTSDSQEKECRMISLIMSKSFGKKLKRRIGLIMLKSFEWNRRGVRKKTLDAKVPRAAFKTLRLFMGNSKSFIQTLCHFIGNS